MAKGNAQELAEGAYNSYQVQAQPFVAVIAVAGLSATSFRRLRVGSDLDGAGVIRRGCSRESARGQPDEFDVKAACEAVIKPITACGRKPSCRRLT